MDFKIEFIQICFRCSADFIQPSFRLFCDVLIGWSLSINRALLFLFSDLHCGPELVLELHACTIYTADLHACTIYFADLLDCMICVHELKIKLLKSKFESCPVSSCSRSWYLGIVTSSFPVSQASCELVFPLVVVTPKSLEFSLPLIPRFVFGRAKPIVTIWQLALGRIWQMPSSWI